MDQRPPLSQSRPLTQACQRAQTRSRNNRSGAVSGRSEPWRRTPTPQRKARKFNPVPSLLSDRRPDAAEPRPQNPSGAVSGRSEPWRRTPSTPSRKARKLILPRAYSASGGLIPRSPAHQNRSGAVSGRSEPWRRTPQSPRAKRERSFFPEPTQRPEARCRGAPPTKTRAERCRAGASLGGEHPNPSRKARKILLSRAYSATGGPMPRSPAHKNRSGAVSGRSEPWRRTPQPLAQSAKDRPFHSLLSDRRPDAA